MPTASFADIEEEPVGGTASLDDIIELAPTPSGPSGNFLERMREQMLAVPESGAIPETLARPEAIEEQQPFGGMMVAGQYVPPEDVPATQAILQGQQNVDFLNRNLLFPASPEFARLAAESRREQALAAMPEGERYGQQRFTAQPEELEALPEEIARQHEERGEFLRGLELEKVPKDVLASLTPAWHAPGEIRKGFEAVRDVVKGRPVEETIQERIPESQEFVDIEEKPWRERLATGLGTAMNLLFAKQIAGHAVPQAPGRPTGVVVPERVKPFTRPELPEAIARQREAQLRGAVKGPEAPTEVISETARPAPAVEAAAQPETIRLYHGSASGDVVGSDFTPLRDYAEGYAAKGETGQVYYVDVPKDAPFLRYDESLGIPINRQILPEEIVQQAKPVGGEPSASEITEPTSVGVQPEGEGVGRTPPLRQPGEAPAIQEEVPGGGPAPEAQAAVEAPLVRVKHGEHAKEGYTAIPTEEAPVTPEVVIPESERGYAGLEPPTTPPVSEPVPGGVPQKPSKIGQSIEAKAVEAKLTQGFPETAGYNPITIADQAQRATDFVASSPAAARAVVRGEAPLPEGLFGESLITAMEEHLLRKPDAQVAYELANSPLVTATSEAAQAMRLMAERVPDSITAKFREIQAARREGAELRGETSAKVARDISKEVVKQASKRPTWEAFVREIVC